MYVLFIGFEKAYDEVSRKKLVEVLKELGCGNVMLKAIVTIYRCTKFILKSALMLVNQGIKQGSSSSSLLFIIYIDRLVKLINENCREDGFLGVLHILMLMDDTVLFSTTRQGLMKKFKLTLHYCDEYNMVINQKKTKYMIISNKKEDCDPICLNEVIVNHCKNYTNFGTTITDDGSYKSVINNDLNLRLKHIFKFHTFLYKNADLPFCMKKRVAEACLMSALLYGCESWLCDECGKMTNVYMSIIKSLLGVRKSTCNDTCLLEANFPSLKSYVT